MPGEPRLTPAIVFHHSKEVPETRRGDLFFQKSPAGAGPAKQVRPARTNTAIGFRRVPCQNVARLPFDPPLLRAPDHQTHHGRRPNISVAQPYCLAGLWPHCPYEVSLATIAYTDEHIFLGVSISTKDRGWRDEPPRIGTSLPQLLP